MVAVVVCKECLLGHHAGCIEKSEEFLNERAKAKAVGLVGGQTCICECGVGRGAKETNRKWYDQVVKYSREAFLP